ncbi:MAG: DUF3124 domain-containing protein [Kiloniellales bacterium]
MTRTGESCSCSRDDGAYSALLTLVTLAALLLLPIQAMAQESNPPSIAKWLGETIYVPAYSHILKSPGRREPLASTLVIHNTDPEVAIKITTVRFHDQSGVLVRDYLDAPRALAPFESASFLDELRNKEGGVGANFVVEWQADTPAIAPIAETVMVGGDGTQGISFTSRGKVIDRRP